VEGTIVSDRAWFARFNMNISFSMVTRVSDDFIYFPIDGIMGLGFQNTSTQNVRIIIDYLFVFEDSSIKIVFITMICISAVTPLG